MTDDQLVHNDGFIQMIIAWMQMTGYRSKRRFLETHLELLESRTITLLETQIPYQMKNIKRVEQVRDLQRIIEDAIARGKTAKAVRDAYANSLGGFILDIPDWLIDEIATINALNDDSTSDSHAFIRAHRWEEAYSRALMTADPLIAAEIAVRAANDFSAVSDIQRAQSQDRAIIWYKQALSDYTETDYPRQWAMTQNNLGAVYTRRIAGERRANQEEAIDCYSAALRVYTKNRLPLDWARTQNNLGNVYRERLVGEKSTNQEQAIAYFTAALHIYSEDQLPFDWAMTQNNLGAVYAKRMKGEKRANQELSILCYTAALRTFTKGQSPLDWAMTQNNLGTVYTTRIAEEKSANQEQAIAFYTAALYVFTEERLPFQWATTQNNLGVVYRDRLIGEKSANQEQAIACYTAALRIFTEDHLPFDWAGTQSNLGAVFAERMKGEKSANQEQAIAYYTAALHVFTEDRLPFDWAGTQSNLGVVYAERIAGEKSANQEQAIACYTAALSVRTKDLVLLDWAGTQNNLANVYRERLRGEKSANQERVITCYIAALSIYTEDSLPFDHRRTARDLATYLCTLKRWDEAQFWYASARRAETLLLALTATARDQDILLNDGSNAVTREAYSHTQLGNTGKAMAVLELGRMRSFAAARAQTAAEPARIRDPQRQARYLTARARLQSAQRTAYLPLDPRLDEQARRTITLQRTAAISEARVAFDACLKEIADAHDPDGFLQSEEQVNLFAQALSHCPAGHTVVDLLSTPWGGRAVGLCSANADRGIEEHTVDYNLPSLTDEIVRTLLENRLTNGPRCVIGGFGWGQARSAFGRFRNHDWTGATFRERAIVLHEACQRTGSTGSFDAAAQTLIVDPYFTDVLDSPLDALDKPNAPQTLYELQETFNHLVLKLEISRVMARLGDVALQPLANWLRQQGVTGVTLIPCGALATFPLLSVPIEWMQSADGSGYWRTFADCFVNGASIAPSAQSLIPVQQAQHPRAGLRGIGDPANAGAPLEWGEAEALTLAQLAGENSVVRTKYGATRTNVLADLKEAWIYEASCHGNGGSGDFLDYGLFLANSERLTLRDIFSGEVADLHGLRLFILSACQTGIIDLRGARDEVRSLAVGLLQAGCEAVLATQWSVNQFATYLLIVRFFQIWQQSKFKEPPAKALAEAQRWLRSVTWERLQEWQEIKSLPIAGGTKYTASRAREIIQEYGQGNMNDSSERPFADPFYWAAFAINGW